MGCAPPVHRVLVTVSNAEIFDEPVYNYTRDFPYLWEEMTLPIPYAADRARAEQILLGGAARHSVLIGEMGEPVRGRWNGVTLSTGMRCGRRSISA